MELGRTTALMLILLSAGLLLLGCSGTQQQAAMPEPQAPVVAPQATPPQATGPEQQQPAQQPGTAQPADLCAGVVCIEATACAEFSCNPETGMCDHKNVNEGKNCGHLMRCGAGECKQLFSLVEKVPESAKVDQRIRRFVAEGVCYAGSGAVMANYYNSSIDDSIFYSYAGSTRFNSNRELGGYGPAPILTTMLDGPRNMGFEVFAGMRKDTNDFADVFLKEVPGENVVKFETTDEAFEYMKRLVASGYPVIVDATMAPIFGAQYQGPDYFVVRGYDAQNVYVNLVFDPDGSRGENYAIPIGKFKQAWETLDPMMGGMGGMGPDAIIWYAPGGKAKSDEDILAMMKKDAEEAPQNTRNYAAMLKAGTEMPQGHMYEAGYYMRSAAANFLRAHGQTDAASKYDESARLYASFGRDTPARQVAGTLEQIASVEQQAVDAWK